MRKFFNDFKAFALKGNVMDMAIGIIIGGAFSKIVSSLVNDIITPIISILTGKVMLSDLKWVIQPAVYDAAGKVVTPETALTYGTFIQTVIDFFIIALSIFLMIRIITKTRERFESMKGKEEENTEPETPAVTELSVLQDIKAILEKEK